MLHQRMFLAIAALFFLSFLYGSLMARRRFRQIWQEMFSFRKELQIARKEITGLRKQLVLTHLGDHLRLPAKLPSEDGEEILLYNFFAHKKNGFYVDVGAYNGVELSNTYFFEAIGWTGILVEPDPGLFRQCQLSRPYSTVLNVAASDRDGSLQFTCAEGKEWLSYTGTNPEREQRILAEGGFLKRIEVPCLTLKEILQDVDQPIDFLSIDVEGFEFNVLNGLNLDTIRPRVIVIEQNPSDRDTPAVKLLTANGYVPRCHLGSNSFYTQANDDGTFHL